MTPLVIYLTGFRQHAGKSVTCLGIISQLKKIFHPSELAYLKPVGQELVRLQDGTRVDKDVRFMKEFSGIPDLDMKLASPVRMGRGFTQHYLTSENTLAQTRKLEDSIRHSFSTLAGKRVIVAEGSGHPGVGGIVGISNADVANLIGADIIFLSGGGIGKALDMLEVDLSYFLYKGSRVRGVIFNKLIPEKMDTVSRYITEDLLNRKYGAFGGPLRILGFFPETKILANPTMHLIADKLEPLELIGNVEDQSWQIPCEGTRVISLNAESLKLDRYIFPHDLVILGASSLRRIRFIIDYHQQLKERGGLGGIILTCGLTESLDPKLREEILKAGIPAVFVKDDTARAEESLLELYGNTKLQLFDSLKVQAIQEIYERYFDLDKFIDTFDLKRLR